MCEAGLCVPRLVINDCVDGVCTCVADVDCPTGTFCDLVHESCLPIECSVISDCALGLVCINRRCLIDSGASLNLLSLKTLTKKERARMKKLEFPIENSKILQPRGKT